MSGSLGAVGKGANWGCLMIMIQFDVNQKELNNALHDLRELTIEKLVSDPEYFKSLSTDKEVRHEVADALNAEHRLTKLTEAIMSLCCNTESPKIVEGVCQELPPSSRGVFLRNVAVVCAHPSSPLHEDSNAQRVAAFASELRTRIEGANCIYCGRKIYFEYCWEISAGRNKVAYACDDCICDGWGALSFRQLKPEDVPWGGHHPLRDSF